MTSDVIALLVNWNSAADTTRTVETLRQLYPDMRAIVIDNGSAQADRLLLNELLCPQATLVQLETNAGYGAGMNAGFRLAAKLEAPFVWLINPDATPMANSLEALLEDSDAAVALSPRQSTSPDPSDTYCSAARVEGYRVRGVTCVGCDQGCHDVDVVTGTGLLLRMSAVQTVGGFDESYFHYKEEFDMVRRMSSLGAVRLVCRSTILHRRGGSLEKRSPVADYYTVRNELLYLRKAGTGRLAAFRQKIRWTLRAFGLVFGRTGRLDEVGARGGYLALALWHGWRGIGGPL